jgi:AraC-like DNA-binding protein
MNESPENSRRMLEALSGSQMFSDYERAFVQGTGLPLRLQAPTLLDVVHHQKKQENPFCALMGKSKETCVECYRLQCKVEEQAQFESKTLTCFAGLCETAVPVRVGKNVIAFLRTGQVMVQKPDKAGFKQIATKVLKWGSEVDLKKLEEHYFNTRVLTPKQYEALIRLLEIFARHLAECGNALALQHKSGETPAIARAKVYISDHSDDELSLAVVAQLVNMSATYFSSKFKEMTGIRFVDYVARVRIEKARSLLLDPQRRVSEVAFEVGFQSLSQFNRTFRSICGESPTEYRTKISAAGK